MGSVRTSLLALPALAGSAAPALAHVNERMPHGHPHGPEVTLAVELAAYGGLALAAAATMGGLAYLYRRRTDRDAR